MALPDFIADLDRVKFEAELARIKALRDTSSIESVLRAIKAPTTSTEGSADRRSVQDSLQAASVAMDDLARAARDALKDVIQGPQDLQHQALDVLNNLAEAPTRALKDAQKIASSSALDVMTQYGELMQAPSVLFERLRKDLDELPLAKARQEAEEALDSWRVQYLGSKSGALREIQKRLRELSDDDKREGGKRFNDLKKLLEASLQSSRGQINDGTAASADEAFDPTVPGRPFRLGHLHPITQTIERMKEIMGRLGFTAVEGPEIEDDWHNFEALNIPLSHPARDPLDNFYLGVAEKGSEVGGQGSGTTRAAHGPDGKPLLLRSQTSTVQIRVMEDTEPPVRIVSLGRVYRPDTADATHYPMFHQIEGLLIDKRVTMADLKSVLRMFCQAYYGEQEDVHVRFRTSFFPFTEPSVEVDINWQGGWMEIGGAGMVDPNVLRAVGYDPEEVSGFAFGMGVERIAMRQHGIRDIRDLYANDVRFLSQF